jgi:hypothetical protein
MAATTRAPQDGQQTARRRWRSIEGRNSGSSITSCWLTVSAGRAPGRPAPQRGHLLADGLGGKSAGQAGAAARALVGTMIDEAIEILAQRAAVAFVTRLGPARPGFLPALLAVSRRRLGRSARRLGRALHPQHQLDQLLLRETLQLGAIHDLMDPEISATDKARG